MADIEPVTDESPPQLLDEARDLFRAYGEFLRASGGAALFCFSRLDEEIATLPAAYSDNRGEILLAREGSQVLGCIAYRAMEIKTDPNCCEVKRLYVTPEARGKGIGRSLVETALERAQRKGFETACLDTEPRSMAVAKQIYLDLGFVEDDERNSRSSTGLVTYFKKRLRPL